MRARRPLILALLLGYSPLVAADIVPRDVTIHRSGGTVRLETRAALADVRLDRYRLDLRERRTTGLLVREQSPGGPFYERGGTTHRLGAVSNVTTLPDGVRLTVATDEGSPATVTLRFLTPRTLEVVLDPPTPAGVAAMGDRFRSPPSERLYGLTERLRDSPALAPGVVDMQYRAPFRARWSSARPLSSWTRACTGSGDSGRTPWSFISTSSTSSPSTSSITTTIPSTTGSITSTTRTTGSTGAGTSTTITMMMMTSAAC